MTRILFLPDENAFYSLESDLKPDQLVLEVNQGRWRPPNRLLPGSGQHSVRLHAVRLGRSAVLVFRLPEGEETGDTSDEGKAEPLSERQLAVLQCLAQGMTTRQIAARLGIARRTVYLHLAAIRRNLGAASTGEAISRAAELGLCQPPAADWPRKN